MSSENCVFCRIVRGEIPAKKIFEDDEMIAFDDISPLAPVHFLVIPKRHIPTLDDLGPGDEGLVGRLMLRAAAIAREKGVADDGYRQIVNCRANGGQEVFHLHLHVLGGRRLAVMA